MQKINPGQAHSLPMPMPRECSHAKMRERPPQPKPSEILSIKWELPPENINVHILRSTIHSKLRSRTVLSLAVWPICWAQSEQRCPSPWHRHKPLPGPTIVAGCSYSKFYILYPGAWQAGFDCLMEYLSSKQSKPRPQLRPKSGSLKASQGKHSQHMPAPATWTWTKHQSLAG